MTPSRGSQMDSCAEGIWFSEKSATLTEWKRWPKHHQLFYDPACQHGPCHGYPWENKQVIKGQLMETDSNVLYTLSPCWSSSLRQRLAVFWKWVSDTRRVSSTIHLPCQDLVHRRTLFVHQLCNPGGKPQTRLKKGAARKAHRKGLITATSLKT